MSRSVGEATVRRQGASLQTFSSLKYRDFRFLWAGTFFSAAGDWIQQVTLGWLVYEITDSALLVGALQAPRALPFLVIGPISGVLSDRMDRRKLLIANQAFLAILALGLAAVISSGRVQVWHLFVFSLFSGGAFAMNTPLRQALVANTVPREGLANAIALSSAAFNINRMVGPAVAGLLIAFFGPGTNFFIQSGCYVAAACIVFFMRVERPAGRDARRSSPYADLRAGLSYVRNEPRTLSLVLIVMIPSLFLMPFTAGLMPVFAKDVLHKGPEGLGLLLSGLGVGSLVGTLVVASLGGKSRSGMVQLGGGVLAGAALMAVSLSVSAPMALPLLAAEGATQMVFFAINNTMLQTMTPDAFRGRVMSLYMLHLGITPVGSFLAGTLAHYYGAPAAMLVGGALVTGLLMLAGARYRVLRGTVQAGPAKAL